MKKNIKIPVIVLALFIFIPLYNVKAYEETTDFKINSELKIPKLKLKSNTFILDFKAEDVNGDKIKDNVLLVGCKEKNTASLFNEDIKIIVQDGKTKKYYKLSPGKIEFGRSGKLFLGEFNGDKVLDILVSIYSSGIKKNSTYSIISFKDNKAVYLFDQEHFSNGLCFDLRYVDDFKVNAFNKEASKFYLIDVSNKKHTYIQEGIYDKNGKTLKDQEGLGGFLEELTPVDIDKDGVYELKAIQELSGICNGDIIGYAKAIWKYENSHMNLLSLEILPYAKPGEMQKIKRVVPVGNF